MLLRVSKLNVPSMFRKTQTDTESVGDKEPNKFCPPGTNLEGFRKMFFKISLSIAHFKS